MSLAEEGDPVSLWFRILLILVGTVLLVLGCAGLISAFSHSFSLVRTIASLGCGVLGIAVAVVATTNIFWLNGKPSPYVSTIEGAIFATITVFLSFLSFVTIVDRTPSALGFENSPEGMFIAPESVLFPVEITLSVVVYAVAVSVTLVILGQISAQLVPKRPREQYYTIARLLILGFLWFVFVALLLLDLGIPGGIGMKGRTFGATPQTGLIMLAIMWALLIVPIPVYTLPLLPDWVDKKEITPSTRRKLLEDHIASNWRRARTLTTLTLTGTVGIVLSFVFSRATPNFFFVVAIVGSVTIGPLGVVWFLMRRIREAEKELRPTPP